MIKYTHLLVTFFLVFYISTLTNAQDLIERTKLGIQPSKTSKPNQIAKLVAAQHQSTARFNEFAPFEVDESTSATSSTESYVTGAVSLNVNPTHLNEFIQNQPTATTLLIPVNSKSSFELELFKVDLFSEDFVFRSSEGENLNHLINGVFYRGIVKGDNNSIAAASIFGEEIRIMIGDNDGNYVIGKHKASSQHVLYNDRNLLLEEPPICGNDGGQGIRKSGLKQQVESQSRNSMMSKCVPIYVECDFDMYTKYNNSEASVIAFVGALVNETATIYANEQIDIALSDVMVWTTTDPYAGLGSTTAVLQKFGELTKNNYNGRLAHFISTRSLGGGVAWVDVLCSSYFTFGSPVNHAGPYAVSASLGTSITTFPTYSWNVEVFTHEMGHNMGSPHTQNCSWNGNDTAIDNCAPTEGGCASAQGSCPPGGGTIMSYCHLTSCGIDFNNGFGTQPGNLIRNRYNNASCTLSCAAPTCDDGIQNGDEEGVDCGGADCMPCPCYTEAVSLSLTLDMYPGETSWTVKNSSGTTIYSGSGYTQANSTINQSFNLPEASGYEFEINDSFGDGICCGFGNGSFTLQDDNGAIIATDGAFGSSYSISFCTEADGPIDNCPGDPNKTEEGICGCGVADTDTDMDGTPDCIDDCPNDSNKTEEGICGCGVADTDTDMDGTPDCIDDCPNDSNKTVPGDCGCGMVENDDNGNGTSDCLEDGICLENQIVSNNSHSLPTVNAQNMIATTGIVEISGNMTFKAGNEIILSPGFHGMVGSSFTAMIETCTTGGSSISSEPKNTNLQFRNIDQPKTGLQLEVMPNPFFQTTTIRYYLNQNSPVTIRLVDLNGRLLKEVQGQNQQNSGWIEVQLERSFLEAGMYYLLLNTPKEQISKKIIVLN